MMTVNRLARLSVGLLVALLAFSVVPAVQSSAAPAAGSGSGLVVQDRSHDNDNPDNQLYALFQILNTGSSPVPLSSLTMRYWLTDQAPTDPLVFACDWAQVNCSNITSKFVVLSTPAAKANTYLQIGFTAAAGSIAPGQGSGEIQTRIHHANYSLFDTSLTYSFISDPSFVYKNTQTVTLYLNGVLIWGVEPS
jgi:cellulose 1,4-beta-cellobiosidase